MKVDALIIDANLIISKYSNFDIFLKQAVQIKDFFDIDLCIPKVVYDECIGNYSSEIDECHQILKGALEKYQRLLIPLKKTDLKIDSVLNEIIKNKKFFKTKLDRFIRNNNVILLDYPSISHSEVVKAIYERQPPFTQKKSELGYKDFLIIHSIKEYQKNNNKPCAILYTGNIKDFSEGNKENKQTPRINTKDDYIIHIASDMKTIIDLIPKNMESKKLNDIFENIDSFSHCLGESILNDILLRDIVYGEDFFEPTSIKDKTCTVKKINIEIDDEFLQINGQCVISFRCDFKLNSLTLEQYDKNFIFYDRVLKLVKAKGYLENETWKMSFYDFSFNKTFSFEYIDFEYKKNKYKSDPGFERGFLTINNIE